MTAPLLAVQGLSKAYGGVRAVEGVGFSLAAGEILALIGPNGAGKSTCFNMLNGQVRPDAGRVVLAGRDITGLAPRKVWRLGTGRTFQITATFGSMTVRENVQVALISKAGRRFAMLGDGSGFARAEAGRLLALVGMADAGERPVAELSYGDLKRLEFAVALANEPRLLLMDEPTAGMAAAERTALMRLVSETARRQGIGVLFTEHDMDVVFGHADRVLVLDRGRLIAEGSPAEVRSDPHVRAVYLGEGFLYDPQHRAATGDGAGEAS